MNDQERFTQQALADMKRREEIMNELLAERPLPYITALIMAGDLHTAEKAWDAMVNEGVPYEQAQVRVGSYARLDFAVRALDEGYTSLDELFEELPELWRGSDPNDQDPRYLDLWKQAYARNGSTYVRDGEAIPSRGTMIKVYRGQQPGEPLGIAWSLDRAIAQKFANGAGMRVANANGKVYTGEVYIGHVLAYLTGRGESEIIVDPANVVFGESA